MTPHLGKEEEKLLDQLLPSCAPPAAVLAVAFLARRGGVSSEPLLSLSLEGARVASESPVTVSAESDRLGLSSAASGAWLSWAICRPPLLLLLWQRAPPWMAGVSVGMSKVSTVCVLGPSSSSLSRLLYDVPLARADSMMLSKWRLKVSSEVRRGADKSTGDFSAGWWLSKNVSSGLVRGRERTLYSLFATPKTCPLSMPARFISQRRRCCLERRSKFSATSVNFLMTH